MTSKGDPIWVQDPNILIQQDRLLEFIPRANMSYSQRINSVVRFFGYAGIILFLLHNNYLFLYVPVVVLVITYCAYIFQSVEIRESYRDLPIHNNNLKTNNLKTNMNGNENNNKVCYRSTIDNPMMNPLPTDDRKRMAACTTWNDEEMAGIVETNFSHNLFKDVNDVYNRNNSQRQWYTVPDTTFGEGQWKFSQWLYGSGMTCKEGNGDQCVANNHTRLNQSSWKFY